MSSPINPSSLKVFQVPIEECSQRIDCTSCTNDPNPLCGWCVVENKCSRQTQCQNSSLSSGWIRDNVTCFFTANVDPMQLVIDPAILAREVMLVYLCVIAFSNIQQYPTPTHPSSR